jgi:hypothetical protein
VCGWVAVITQGDSRGRLLSCLSARCRRWFRSDKKIKYHLDYQTLREHRKRLDCRHVILTHMSRDMLSRLGDVEFECAEDGKIVVL